MDRTSFPMPIRKRSIVRFALAPALALLHAAAWCQTTPAGEQEVHRATLPAEEHVRAVSSIKRLTDGMLSCAELQSRVAELDRLSAGSAQQANAAATDVEHAQRELIAGATIPAPPASSLAMGAAVTVLEAVPIAGNLASSVITRSVATPAVPVMSAQAHAAALRSVMETGKLQMIQYATAARRDHLRELHTRNHCAGVAP